jgi:hypothetical protein
MIKLLHCDSCDHEWESVGEERESCDWCGGGSYVLRELEITNFNVYDSFEKFKIIKRNPHQKL